MTPLPRVDVVMPLYNNERYAVEAIRSALNQTLPPARIIVVDDGSTDRSAAIVEEAFAVEPKVEVVRAVHGGVSMARSRAMQEVTGDYIAFLDSDDRWLPEKLERQLALLERSDNPPGVVYCAYRVIDENGAGVADAHVIAPSLRGEIFRPLLQGNLISGSCSAVVMRRELADQVGVMEDRLHFGEDWDYWLRLAKVAAFDFCPEALTEIRVHGGQSQQVMTCEKRFTMTRNHFRLMEAWKEELRYGEMPAPLYHDLLAPAWSIDLCPSMRSRWRFFWHQYRYLKRHHPQLLRLVAQKAIFLQFARGMLRSAGHRLFGRLPKRTCPLCRGEIAPE